MACGGILPGRARPCVQGGSNTRPLSRVEGAKTRARKPPGHSRTISLGSRFRASKAAQSRRGESKMDDSPRTPSRPYEVRKAAAQLGGSGRRGLHEFPHKAEASLCKVAARVPLQVSMQPQRPKCLICYSYTPALPMGRVGILHILPDLANNACNFQPNIVY